MRLEIDLALYGTSTGWPRSSASRTQDEDVYIRESPGLGHDFHLPGLSSYSLSLLGCILLLPTLHSLLYCLY
jgi:hypothetical protein